MHIQNDAFTKNEDIAWFFEMKSPRSHRFLIGMSGDAKGRTDCKNCKSARVNLNYLLKRSDIFIKNNYCITYLFDDGNSLINTFIFYFIVKYHGCYSKI